MLSLCEVPLSPATLVAAIIKIFRTATFSASVGALTPAALSAWVAPVTSRGKMTVMSSLVAAVGLNLKKFSTW